MEKLKNVIKDLKQKLGQKSKPELKAEVESIGETSFVDEMMVVSDYAVALGANCIEPTGDPIKDLYHWCERDKRAPLYRLNYHEKQLIHHDEPVGIAPIISNIYTNEFSIRGGYLAYQHECVYFPQRRVDQKLNTYLTEVVINKTIKLAENEFGKINSYTMTAYGDDKKNGIKQSYYYYQGEPYCLRFDKKNPNDQYQWFNLDLIVAQQFDDKIACDEILFADHSYDEKKFMNDLKGSVVLNHTVPRYFKATKVSQEKSDDEQIKG